VVEHQKIDRPSKSRLPAFAKIREVAKPREASATDLVPSTLDLVPNSEANASGADAPPDPSIPEREYFLRGREVLGKSGAMIANLLKAKGRNVAMARAALEQASQKQNPTEYIAAICRGPPAVRPTTAHQVERQTGREILDDIGKFIGGSSSQADLGLLRHDPGDGPEGVRGGSRGDLIELSPPVVARAASPSRGLASVVSYPNLAKFKHHLDEWHGEYLTDMERVRSDANRKRLPEPPRDPEAWRPGLRRGCETCRAIEARHGTELARHSAGSAKGRGRNSGHETDDRDNPGHARPRHGHPPAYQDRRSRADGAVESLAQELSRRKGSSTCRRGQQ
jgi:hypothetical protein